MSLDIGEAFSDGTSRTFAKNGLLLAVAFAVVSLALTAFQQMLFIGTLEEMLAFYQTQTPSELGIPQAQYDQTVETIQQALSERRASPLAFGLPVGVAAGALLVVAIVSESVSIVAVRVFAVDSEEAISTEMLTNGLPLATLNGFVGSIVVGGLVLVGLVLLIVPGVFLAVVFFFMRQRIALEGENFIDAMAESWRLTKGYRIEVFALALLVAIVTFGINFLGASVGIVSPIGGIVASTVLTGVTGAFGAAVVTRGYVQLEADGVNEEGGDADPYDAALGPDDIPE